MENKKIIIITIVLFLLAGTGTFVFASNQGNFNEEDIDYRTDKDPTYEKVEDDKKGQDVPVIDNNIPDENLDNNNNIDDSNTNQNDDDNNLNGSSNNNSNSSTSKPSKPNRPSWNLPDNTVNGGNTGNSDQGNNNQENNNNSEENNNNNNEEDNNSGNTEEGTLLTAELSYSNKELTNKNVTITITANKEIKETSDNTWTISGSKTTKTFDSNTVSKKEITIYDNNGKSVKLDYEINNIDKVKPKLTLTYSETNTTYKPITVTITSDKKIAAINETGWKYVNDSEISKVFEENTNGELIIQDLAGNQEKINYKIENYSNNPIFKNETNEDSSTTIIYKEPIGDSAKWEECEDGYQLNVPLGNSLKNSPSLETDGIEVLISNVNEKGKATKVNTPVIVTIRTNKELEPLEGWILSEDKTSLKKIFINANKDTINIKCADGSTFDNIQYNVSLLDTVKPQINSIEVINKYTIEIILSELSLINDGIDWGQMRTIIGSKTYQKEELINIGNEGILEEIKLEDNYSNISTQFIKLYYDAEKDKLSAEIVK